MEDFPLISQPFQLFLSVWRVCYPSNHPTVDIRQPSPSPPLAAPFAHPPAVLLLVDLSWPWAADGLVRNGKREHIRY